jgi:hypothetical protein
LVASGLSGIAGASSEDNGRGNFVVDCRFSHRLSDDPIVYPGQPGASHLHNFYGNSTTDAFSTVDSMRAGATTCRLLQDKAGYWNPAGYLLGKRLRPERISLYYSGLKFGRVETIPPGLQMIAGDHDATSAAQNQHAAWFCGARGTPLSRHPYNCARYENSHGVTGVVTFPTCWDGTGIRFDDVRYADHGCPARFRHHIPRLIYQIHFGIEDPCAGHRPCAPEGSGRNVKLTLSSGSYYTLHADFWNTWMQDKLNQLVQRCINAHVKCFQQFSYQLSVEKTGTGTGTVSSYPSGISCGTTCLAIYDKGATVTLNAQADLGSVFVGWGGDCTGPEPCVLSMSKNRKVIAAFVKTG